MVGLPSRRERARAATALDPSLQFIARIRGVGDEGSIAVSERVSAIPKTAKALGRDRGPYSSPISNQVSGRGFGSRCEQLPG